MGEVRGAGGGPASCGRGYWEEVVGHWEGRDAG